VAVPVAQHPHEEDGPPKRRWQIAPVARARASTGSTQRPKFVSLGGPPHLWDVDWLGRLPLEGRAPRWAPAVSHDVVHRTAAWFHTASSRKRVNGTTREPADRGGVWSSMVRLVKAGPKTGFHVQIAGADTRI